MRNPLNRLRDGWQSVTAQNAGLEDAVRRTSQMRTGLYVVVLLVALYGQSSGAVAQFGLPWPVALPAIATLELGAVVVMASADVRRRLGEQAVMLRLIAFTIAAAGTGFNLIAHPGLLAGGFFAFMSALGFMVFVSNMESGRRDRLRATGQLPPPAPAYPVAQWAAHPLLTWAARHLAKADETLGLYGSLDLAKANRDRKRRNAKLASALYRKLKGNAGGELAKVAMLTYDLDRIAAKLRDDADYAGLTALLGTDLDPSRLLGTSTADSPARTIPDGRDGRRRMARHNRRTRATRVHHIHYMPRPAEMTGTPQDALRDVSGDALPEHRPEEITQPDAETGMDGMGPVPRPRKRVTAAAKKRPVVVKTTAAVPIPDAVLNAKVDALPLDGDGKISINRAHKLIGSGAGKVRIKEVLAAKGIWRAGDEPDSESSEKSQAEAA